MPLVARNLMARVRFANPARDTVSWCRARNSVDARPAAAC